MHLDCAKCSWEVPFKFAMSCIVLRSHTCTPGFLLVFTIEFNAREFFGAVMRVSAALTRCAAIRIVNSHKEARSNCIAGAI